MKIERYKKISSTSEIAKNLKPKPWTIILAEEQEKGYGREKREWFSPKGGLYFTVVLPKIDIDDLQILTLLAAFSVAQKIKEKFNLETFIKIPNDVLIFSKPASQKPKLKKICGVLTENVVGRDVKFSIMGIGLNTNIKSFPEDLKDVATSVEIETGRKTNNEKILLEIIDEIKNNLKTITH